MENIIKKYEEFKKIKKEKPYKKLKVLKFLKKIKLLNFILPPIITAPFVFSFFFTHVSEKESVITIIMSGIICTIILSLMFTLMIHLILSACSKIFNKRIEKEIQDLNKNYKFNNHINFIPSEVAKIFSFNDYSELEYIHKHYNFDYTSDIDFFITEFKNISDKDFLENINIIFKNINKNKVKENDRKNLFDFIFSKYKTFLENEIININTFNSSMNTFISQIYTETDGIVYAKNYLKNYVDYYEDLNKPNTIQKNSNKKLLF